MDVGNNAGAVLAAHVDRIVGLHLEIKKLKGRIKDLKSDLKEEGLPPAALIKVATMDPEKAEQAAEDLKVAGAFLGKTVFADAVDADEDLVEKRCEAQDGLREFVLEKVDAVIEAQGEVDGLKAEIKRKLNEAKEEGFSKPVLEQIVEFKLDPKKLEKRRESGVLLDTYMKAIGL